MNWAQITVGWGWKLPQIECPQNPMTLCFLESREKMQFNKKKSSKTVNPLKNGECLKFDDFRISRCVGYGLQFVTSELINFFNLHQKIAKNSLLGPIFAQEPYKCM